MFQLPELATKVAHPHLLNPLTDRDVHRFGNRYGLDLKLEDSLAAALVDQNPGGTKTAMGGEYGLLFYATPARLQD